jgi:hypothetical protein
VPPGIGYVPDSIAERIVALTARRAPLDPDLLELLSICIPELHAEAESHTGEARRYFADCAALLEEIAG